MFEFIGMLVVFGFALVVAKDMYKAKSTLRNIKIER